MKKFWKLTNIVDSSDSELVIEGVISQESWWGDEATPQQLRDELKNIKSKNLTVSINSVGGDVWAGVAMYNALRELEAKVTIRVDGLAASIASVIAMAGDEIIMSPGSMMMIHRASALAMGNAEDLEKAIEMLETVEESIIPIYVERTGLSTEEIAKMMDEETWMSAEKTVELGFADKVASTKKEEEPAAQLSGNFAFSMSAVQTPLKDLMKKVNAKNEADEPTPEPEVTPPEEPEVVAEEVQEPEAEEVVESPAEETNKSTDEELSKMENDKKDDDNTVIAQTQVIPPANQAEVKPKPQVNDYLKTNASMEAFARILEENPGEIGGSSSAKVRDAWKSHLETTMGVTNPEIFLPTPLVTAIQNAFEDGGEIWNRVAKVGADVWNAAWDVEDDLNSEDGRARGYNREDQEEKAEQSLTFDSRILRPQFVYKYITLNKEDIKEQRSTGALITYILSELPQRIVREVERAIVLGDGRDPSDDYKIKEGDPRGFYPILGDADEGNFFAGVVEVTGDEAAAEVVALAIDEIKTPGEIVLIAKKGYGTRARFAKDSNGDYLFPIGTKATDILGVSTIIEPDWFNDTNSPDYDAVVVVLSGYKVVGDNSIEGFSNFILKTNKQEYLQEIWAGGGLSQKKAAIAIPADVSS